MTVQERAAEAAGFFERAERSAEAADWRYAARSYVRLRDDAPGWVSDLVQQAHGDMLPDDWRYGAIEDALLDIADRDDPDDGAGEFADGADIYNADLLAWVGSHGARAGYVDDARDEYGEPRDFYHGLQMGQYMERSEVYGLVLDALRAAASPFAVADD